MSFVHITREQMDEFLLPRGFQTIQVPGIDQSISEIVYAKIVRKGNHRVSMRIYSSITPSGVSRGKGEDAIRVICYVMYDGKPLPVGKSQRVQRIATWRNNLGKAIERWSLAWKDCPKCAYPMVLKKGKNGPFWGCSTWSVTKCNGIPEKNTVTSEPQKKLKPVVQEKPKSEPQKKSNPVTQEKPTRSATPFQIPEDKISEYQKQVETEFRTTNAHLILPSRAGGGKTTMLRHLSNFRQPGQKMVYLAFNRKNAIEGRKKLPKEVSSMTTHSFCCRMIREQGIKLPKNPDSGKTWRIVNEIYPHLNSNERVKIRRAAVRLVDLAKNFAIRVGDLEGIRNVYNQYTFNLENEAQLTETISLVNEVLGLSLPGEKYGVVYDYNDMIWWPIVLDMMPPKYDVVLLDEIQDFNTCQLELVKRLINQGSRIIAVGDEFQAVYRFRGADSDSFEKVSNALVTPDRDCKTVLLPVNYRCGSAILDWVVENTVVQDIVPAPNAITGKVEESVEYQRILDMLVAEYGTS